MKYALFVMVLAKEFTFQIIEEALSTAIDIAWIEKMVNASGQPTKRREKNVSYTH